ncbi:MAG: hypothetical protein ACTSYQ_02500 [Candidatus Odinarchaeia archaeon]
MPISLHLLPCDRVPIYECLNGTCDKCYKILIHKSIEPILENVEDNIESIVKTIALQRSDR